MYGLRCQLSTPPPRACRGSRRRIGWWAILARQNGESSHVHLCHWGFCIMCLSVSPCSDGVLRYRVSCSWSGAATYLNVYGNGLAGSMPTELALATTLTRFNFYNNELTSTIPSQLGLLTNLEGYFIVAANELEGSIPSELGMLSKLSNYLRLDMNYLTGSIPSELGGLTKITEYFYLAGPTQWNQLCDTIPSEVLALSSQVSNGWGVTFSNDIGTPCCKLCLSLDFLCLFYALNCSSNPLHACPCPALAGEALPSVYTCSPTPQPTSETKLAPTPQPSHQPTPAPSILVRPV